MAESTMSLAMTPERRAEPWLDWTVAVLGVWLVGAVHFDAWAHHRFELETFFTPWHGVLYTGFLVTVAVLGWTLLAGRRRGFPWPQAMPTGYWGSLLGVLVFLAGGVADMVWHTLLGIEVSVEALLSPPHLLLAAGGALMITGPIRAAASGDGDRALPAPWPAVIALAMVLALMTFFTAYANPLSEAMLAQGHRPATGEGVFLTQGLGTAGILVQSVLMTGAILWALRRWRLPAGAISLILTLSSLMTMAVHEVFQFLPGVVVAGLSADLLHQRLKPSVERPGDLRAFAAAVPVIFYVLYFVTLALTGGMWWRIHLWAGDIILAGVVGGLLSHLMIPPAMRPGQAPATSGLRTGH